ARFTTGVHGNVGVGAVTDGRLGAAPEPALGGEPLRGVRINSFLYPVLRATERESRNHPGRGAGGAGHCLQHPEVQRPVRGRLTRGFSPGTAIRLALPVTDRSVSRV